MRALLLWLKTNPLALIIGALLAALGWKAFRLRQLEGKQWRHQKAADAAALKATQARLAAERKVQEKNYKDGLAKAAEIAKQREEAKKKEASAHQTLQDIASEFPPETEE